MSEQPGGEIILYQRGDATTIDVRLIGDTVWLSLNQIADLLGRDKFTISRHIAKVFAEGELERNSVVAEFATTAADGKTYQVEHFNFSRSHAPTWECTPHLPMHKGSHAGAWEPVVCHRCAARWRYGLAEPGSNLSGIPTGSPRRYTRSEAEYAKFRQHIAEQPSEMEAAYLETVKAVQKKITGKKKP